MEASASTGTASPQLFLQLELSDEDMAELVLTGKFDSPSSASNSEDKQLQKEQEMRLKREKRMKSNRESARRSRMKKQMQLDMVQSRLEQLWSENGVLKNKLSLAMKRLKALNSGNDALRMCALELNSRLHYLYTQPVDEDPFDLVS